MAYYLSGVKRSADPKNVSSGNIFGSLVGHPWEGALAPMWRFAYDPVHHSLIAKKPFVVTTEDIKLTKGMPLKIMWRARDADS